MGAPESPGVASVARDGFVFAWQLAPLGRFALRPLRLPDDLGMLHAWVSRPAAQYWGLGGRSPAEVELAYIDILRDAVVLVGCFGGEPAFLVECYAPSRAPVGAHYAVQPGDRGMHVLLAPTQRPLHGFSWAVFRTVMEFVFSDPEAARVVVEPDVRNAKIHALNRRAGFRYQKLVQLPGKLGHLAFCSRADYHAALQRERSGEGVPAPAAESTTDPIGHLRPGRWAAVNRALVRKAISEFAHERLLCPRRLARERSPVPQLLGSVVSGGEDPSRPAADSDCIHNGLGTAAPDGQGSGQASASLADGIGFTDYVLATDQPDVEYRFRARVLALEHWDIELSSIEKRRAGEPVALDALDLMLELRASLGLHAAVLPVYLEEITSTLYAASYKHAYQRYSAADLVHAHFQELEAAMTEGHPAFVANSGRVGFDASDYRAFAPEADAPVQLIWLAAHVRRAHAATTPELDYPRLLLEELGAQQLDAFERQLRQLGLAPRDYLLIPVHPWQWFNRLSSLFAPDIATRELVCLGQGAQAYQAQQSIRTFFNREAPTRRYVKTALSVLNMGFMRGLSAQYMANTPAINQYVHDLIAQDAYFAERGFRILRELGSVGYRSACFEGAVAPASPYRKLLAALFRESPVAQLPPGQRLMTMAALLHRDRDGAALLPQLIAASGLGLDAWLDHFLQCYLAPILHCFYAYDLAFMPHGENVILRLQDSAVVGAFMKDIAEEVVIMDPQRELPELVRRIRVQVPDELKPLSIFTDVFDGILRYAAQILLEQADYAQERFWRRVARCVRVYQREHPALAPKFQRYDLFAPSFLHSCLNRLQLRNNQQMVDLSDPAQNLQFAGRLDNPIAPFRSN